MSRRRSPVVILIPLILLGLSACATVPKETVSLSMTVGEDLQQLQAGYTNTVKFSFEQMRQRGLTVIDEKWTPVYLKDFVQNGGLVEAAQGNQMERVEMWARIAIKAIDDKRSGFTGPLDKKEAELLADIDEAFGRVISANAAVTANLNSVLKVQELQDDILEAFKVKDVRDRINDGIAEASNWAASETKKIQDATAEVSGGP